MSYRVRLIESTLSDYGMTLDQLDPVTVELLTRVAEKAYRLGCGAAS